MLPDVWVHLACDCGNRDDTIAPLRSLPPCSAECGRKMFVIAGPQKDLRDYFAGQALIGVINQSTIAEVAGTIMAVAARYGVSEHDVIARAAYTYADAMLAAREKKPEAHDAVS
jgi:hypothetical protein